MVNGLAYRTNSPQPGLVPIGDSGFYATPNTPADPTDCSRYPNSFFCGGGLRTVPASITVQPVLDNCNIGISISGSLAFIGLPTFQILYRFSDCRNLPSLTPKLLPLAPIPIAPNNCVRNDGMWVIMPTHILNYAATLLNSSYFAPVKYELYDFDLIEIQRDIPAGTYSRSGLSINTFLRFKVTKSQAYSRDQLLIFGSGQNFLIPPGSDVNFVYTYQETQTVTYAITRGNSYGIEPYLESDLNFVSGLESEQFNQYLPAVFSNYENFTAYCRERSDNLNLQVEIETPYYALQYIYSANQQPTTISISTPYGNFLAESNGIIADFYYSYYRYQGTGTQHYELQYSTFEICNNYKRDPPPPPPKKKCCEENDLACCPDNSDLLKAILAKLNTLSQIVGVADYPASLPQSLITKNGKNPGNISIPNLTQLLGWYIQRFDEIVGQFEIDLDIAKPDKPGETIPVRLPNLAESIAELMTLSFQNSINSELLVNICNRTLIEAGQQKQQDFKNYMAIQSIIEYLGFGVDETSEKMPLSFKPGETSFSKMLVETEIDVKGSQFNGEQGFHAALLDLLQAAAIIRAVHWRKLDQTKDVAAQLFNSILAVKTVKDAIFNHDDCLDFDINQLINDTIKQPNNQPSVTVTPAVVTPSTGES